MMRRVSSDAARHPAHATTAARSDAAAATSPCTEPAARSHRGSTGSGLPGEGGAPASGLGRTFGPRTGSYGVRDSAVRRLG